MGCALLLHIPALTVAPFWQEMTVEKEGLNEWEGGQVAAFEILQKICQEHVEEMGRTPMCFFPPLDLNNATWCQRGIELIDESQPNHCNIQSRHIRPRPTLPRSGPTCVATRLSFRPRFAQNG
jgi:hypothetical protein